jgi:hypothetical protein
MPAIMKTTRITELEAMCAELRDALADANDIDAAAEGQNSANFRHKRKEFDELATRAGRMLSNGGTELPARVTMEAHNNQKL